MQMLYILSAARRDIGVIFGDIRLVLGKERVRRVLLTLRFRAASQHPPLV
jgi:ABC-type ATPase involved in cell division